MLISILICFVFSGVFLLSSKWIKGKFALLTSVLPLGLFIYFLSFLPMLSQGGNYTEHTPWVPSLGVDFSLVADGLSVLFSLMITGIGTLVFVYSAGYMKSSPYLHRFYGYLGIFMGAMLGVVLSQNIITLFLFWELTSISSFFLIGFNTDDEGSRKSAIRALTITGLGGLLLLTGCIMLGQISGTYNLSEMLFKRDIIQQNALYVPILWLIFGAAFTKSAQFPFHFWLPGAMKAPTPVSTYLHSATMVKAGIYLLLRFTPILGDNANWNTPLMVVGGITMVYGAVHTLFRIDMKAILAYSTLSALGILTFLIGIGTEKSLLACGVFILVHATYKATLFLITGIVDHSTHTRNVTLLSGLQKVLAPVGLIAFVAALSNAGVPLTFGFIGKDLIYEATLAHSDGWWLTIIAILVNVLLLYAGFVVGVKPFVGELPQHFSNIKPVKMLLWVPPAILAGVCFLLGIFPSIIESSLIGTMLEDLGKPSDFHLQMWHGFTDVLLYSGITLLLGGGLYYIVIPSEGRQRWVERFEYLSPKHIFHQMGVFFTNISRIISKFLQSGYLTRYVRQSILVATILLGYSILGDLSYEFTPVLLSEITFQEVVVLVVLITSILFAALTESRLAAVVALGLLSFSMCMIFMMYSAPDLAMTQFSIDTLTAVLFVLLLYKLPNYLKIHTHKVKIADGLLALSFGIMITLTCLEVLSVPQRTEVSSYYAENSYIQAHGKNIVNVILVDFRGADTMMEISVLSIAAIGVFGLIKLRLKGKERYKS